MKTKFPSPVKCYLSLLLLLLVCLNVSAQQKILFTDNFADNHNNWPEKGKKIAVTKETGYAIDNIKSKENFIPLQTVPFDAARDFELSMKIQYAGNTDFSTYHAGAFFGGSDEKNGYALVLCVDGTIQLLKLTNGIPEQVYMQASTYKADVSEKTISIKSEHGRWKIGTIANIRALPLFGNKAGIYVPAGGKWQIHSLDITEKEKEAGWASEEFPIALFMARFKELRCDADDRFRENVDQTKDYMNKNIPFNKSIPGFVDPMIIYKESSIELFCDKNFYDLDKAYTYFDDLKAAINLSSANCLRFLKYKNNDELNKFFSDFIDYGYWESGATDMKNGKIIDVSNAVIQILNEPPVKAGGKKHYLVAFHILITWKEK